jgi:hypothetical protein
VATISRLYVDHGVREDQAGKGYFLIGDGVAGLHTTLKTFCPRQCSRCWRLSVVFWQH